jgi:hypothetical protein
MSGSSSAGGMGRRGDRVSLHERIQGAPPPREPAAPVVKHCWVTDSYGRALPCEDCGSGFAPRVAAGAGSTFAHDVCLRPLIGCSPARPLPPYIWSATEPLGRRWGPGVGLDTRGLRRSSAGQADESVDGLGSDDGGSELGDTLQCLGPRELEELPVGGADDEV